MSNTKLFYNGIRLESVSSDPSSPVEGQVQYADGTARTEGLHYYDGSTWIQVATGTAGSLNVTTKTGAYTITASDDVILADANSAGFTLTLPAAASNSGKQITIKKIDTTANVVTVDGNASETIDGELTYLLSQETEGLRIVCDGSNWQIVSHTSPIIAIYESNAGQTITASSLEVVDFEDVVIDPYSTVTTGASWNFTAPKAGRYLTTGVVAIDSVTDGKPIDTRIRKGGVLIAAGTRLLAAGSAETHGSTFCSIIDCDEGDTIDVQIFNGDSSNRSLNSSTAFVRINIIKLD